MQVRIDIEFAALDKQLQRLIKKITADRPKELEIWRKAAVPVVEAIKELTPVGTVDKWLYYNGTTESGPYAPGTLRDSIMVLPHMRWAVVIGSNTREYASYRQRYALHFFMLEYGTRNFRGAFFMRRGAVRGAPACVRIMIREYQKLLKEQIAASERG